MIIVLFFTFLSSFILDYNRSVIWIKSKYKKNAYNKLNNYFKTIIIVHFEYKKDVTKPSSFGSKKADIHLREIPTLSYYTRKLNVFYYAGKKIRTSTEIILHKILSLARLPIPPYPRTSNILQFIKFNIKYKFDYNKLNTDILNKF